MNGLVSRKLVQQSCLLYQVRSAGGPGYWNKDWMPGPVPKTQEEREAAAKKYNLLPHEYEPYKEDDLFIQPGDYPKLPDVSVENKDVYYPWEHRNMRRGFGEPLHVHSIFQLEDRTDSHLLQKKKYSPLQMFLGLAGSVGFFLCGFVFNSFRFFPPVAARQVHTDGGVHYGYNK